MTEVRPLRPDQWRLLKQVRLAALGDSPEAFSATLAETRERPDSSWQQRAADNTSFTAIAMDAGEPVGLALGLPDPEDATRAYLVSMWVAPDHRGTDTAGALLDLVESWASAAGASRLLAGVKASNVGGAAFYRKRGYESYTSIPPEHPAVSGCELVLSKKLQRESE